MTTNKLNPSTQSGAKTSADRNAVQQDVLEQSDKLVSELRAAEILLIGLPIYNFIMPAIFDMWIDLICHVGETFNYTENGPVGSIVGKRVIVSVASGSVPIGSPMDPATPYLTEVFGFIVITNMTYVSASGSAAALEKAIWVVE
ncbi:MAG: NAD(P)H-dependent oxidoreductase, partial [Rhodospirillales bacterium]|nr:NAD(P)H-dependent oxidoreductase [Rhodospirillales bacterium]